MMAQEDIDGRLKKLMDMASGVVEGAGRYEQRSSKLIRELDALRDAIARQATTYENQTKAAISNAVDTTATKVAGVLLEKFKGANQAADNARRTYEKAAKRLGWRLLAIALLLQTILFGGGWMLIQRTVPTLADIQSRQQQLADLGDQIAAEQKTLEMLDHKGGRMQWTQCGGRPCVRVDTQHTYYGTDDATKAYFIPWGY